MSEFRSRCNWYSTAIGSSAFKGRDLPTGQLFGVFDKFRHEICVIQPDQSDCERMTMPLGSVSLGLLAKLSVWTQSGPGSNISFSFLVRTKRTKRTEVQVWMHPKAHISHLSFFKWKILNQAHLQVLYQQTPKRSLTNTNQDWAIWSKIILECWSMIYTSHMYIQIFM